MEVLPTAWPGVLFSLQTSGEVTEHLFTTNTPKGTSVKIELPEDTYRRVWTKDPDTREVLEWNSTPAGWVNVRSDTVWTWLGLLTTYRGAYTEHPDFAALEKYPAPWTVGATGTVRSAGRAGGVGRVVLDPTVQCPPCLTALIVHAVNELAERISGSTDAGECAADEGEGKR